MLFLLPAEGHIEVHNNRQQQPDSVFANQRDDNNYHLYARKICCPEDGFFIRAILMKNNEIIFNYTYKIIGTENVRIATIVSANQVCNHYLQLAMKGDTFLISLGDGHLGMHASIVRNAHLANFIKTFNKIKIDLYIIVSSFQPLFHT